MFVRLETVQKNSQVHCIRYVYYQTSLLASSIHTLISHPFALNINKQQLHIMGCFCFAAVILGRVDEKSIILVLKDGAVGLPKW
jgi:hypothetical protein